MRSSFPPWVASVLIPTRDDRDADTDADLARSPGHSKVYYFAPDSDRRTVSEDKCNCTSHIGPQGGQGQVAIRVREGQDVIAPSPWSVGPSTGVGLGSARCGGRRASMAVEFSGWSESQSQSDSQSQPQLSAARQTSRGESRRRQAGLCRCQCPPSPHHCRRASADVGGEHGRLEGARKLAVPVCTPLGLGLGHGPRFGECTKLKCLLRPSPSLSPHEALLILAARIQISLSAPAPPDALYLGRLYDHDISALSAQAPYLSPGLSHLRPLLPAPNGPGLFAASPCRPSGLVAVQHVIPS
ncbi:hypothetical protein C8Q77DRAFT_511363 [Trametes polyzona]|nr:hypothetical protein C8Q77DRAFT_511363 [Trametes polyzona]